MGLLKLKSIDRSQFDPIAEAQKALEHYELDQLALSAFVFGSATKENFSPESDIDVLVVFPTLDTVKKAQHKLKKRPFSEWPIDWIFKTQESFDQRRKIGGVCYTADREGVKIL